MLIEIETLETLENASAEIIKYFGNEKIIIFNGLMGAGKTTLIKAICKTMGVEENVNSPTFSIVNEYRTINGEVIYHFDCYRINTVDEAREIGIEEYLYSKNYCFIEWAENISPLLPDQVLKIDIKEIENGIRIVEIKNK